MVVYDQVSLSFKYPLLCEYLLVIMKLKINFIAILFINACYLSGCQQGGGDIHITVDEFLNLCDTTEAIFLDVRTRPEYEAGHLEGAILINMQAPDFTEKISELDKNNIYYVYCRSGARSTNVVKQMRKAGFFQTYNIKGGIIELTRKGIQIVK
jgi:phage shock protein E